MAWRKDANWEEVMKKRKCEEPSMSIRGPRVTPRSLLVRNPHTSTIVTFTPPCKPKLPIKFSDDDAHLGPTLVEHPSRTAAWCVLGAENGVRSGGVEAYGPSERRISWQEEGGEWEGGYGRK